MDSEEAIELAVCIQQWAKSQPSFSTTFIDSCTSFYARRGYLSVKQIEAINGIYFRWGISKWITPKTPIEKAIEELENE